MWVQEATQWSNWIVGLWTGQPIRDFVYLPPIFNRSCEADREWNIIFKVPSAFLSVLGHFGHVRDH